MKRTIDLLGHKFGRLTVCNSAGISKWGYALWDCLCECGKTCVAAGGDLRSGRVKSCGCLALKRDGQSRSPEYVSWSMMMHRCNNPENPNYGGRGIKVCDRWKSFENFQADMGVRPKRCSIERKNNAGNYEPGNCIWATRLEQALNKRNNVWITVDGVTKTQSQWAERLAVPQVTILSRLKRGWTAEEAVKTPIAPSGTKASDGKFLSLRRRARTGDMPNLRKTR